MPYRVRKQDCAKSDGSSGTHVVQKKKGSKWSKSSCHSSEEKAKAAIRARHISELDEEAAGLSTPEPAGPTPEPAESPSPLTPPSPISAGAKRLSKGPMLTEAQVRKIIRQELLKEAVEDRNLAALLDFSNGFVELDEQGQSDLNSLVNAHLEGTEEDFDEVVTGIVPNSIELMWDALNGVDSSIDDLLTRARESIDVEEEL